MTGNAAYSHGPEQPSVYHTLEGQDAFALAVRVLPASTLPAPHRYLALALERDSVEPNALVRGYKASTVLSDVVDGLAATTGRNRESFPIFGDQLSTLHPTAASLVSPQRCNFYAIVGGRSLLGSQLPDTNEAGMLKIAAPSSGTVLYVARLTQPPDTEVRDTDHLGKLYDPAPFHGGVWPLTAAGRAILNPRATDAMYSAPLGRSVAVMQPTAAALCSRASSAQFTLPPPPEPGDFMSHLWCAMPAPIAASCLMLVHAWTPSRHRAGAGMIVWPAQSSTSLHVSGKLLWVQHQFDAHCVVHALHTGVQYALFTLAELHAALLRARPAATVLAAGYLHAGDLASALSVLAPTMRLIEGTPHMGRNTCLDVAAHPDASTT